jgi:transcriptional regulator with XRE-family HTH domain
MIGNRIRQARLATGLTLEAVVERLKELGESITRQGLSNYENNKRGPGPATLMKLAKALNG